MKAWRSRSRFNGPPGDARGWLLTITANTARDVAKGKGAAGSRLSAVPDPPEPTLPGWAPMVDSAIDVERAVATLPRRQRLAVNCFYFAGLSITETAAVMHCAPGTVKSALAHARTNLRSALEEF